MALSIYERSVNKLGALMDWCWQGKTEVLGEKPVPVPLFPPHPMCTGLGLNPGHRKRLATGHLSDGTAKLSIIIDSV